MRIGERMRLGITTNGLRTIFGFLLAPLVPGLLLGLLIPSDGHGSSGFWGAIRIAAVAGYPPAAILGIPLYCLLVARGWISFFVYAALGPVMGAAAFIIALIGTRIWGGGGILYLFFVDATFFLSLMVLTTIATISFWFIVHAGRPRPATRPGEAKAGNLS